jgi:hypothetical protein
MYIFYDQESTGTPGGTFNANSWVIRTLGSSSSYGGTNVTLASNTLTFQPGIYHIYSSAPAFRVEMHQTRLQIANNTGSTGTIVMGTSEYSGNGEGSNTEIHHTAQTRSIIDCIFTVSTPISLQVQHRCNYQIPSGDSEAIDGLGMPTGFGSYEVYTQVWIIKLA